MRFLVSPTEHDPAVAAIGRAAFTPERHGVDILWAEPKVGGLIGIQRKELKDLIASVTDGRLAKEVQQMQSLKLAVLAVEGRANWTPDGVFVHRFVHWTRAQHRSLLRSVQQRGIVVEFTDDSADTVALCYEIAAWAAKGNHHSLDTRPKPFPDKWGTRTSKAWGIHMLQSVPGIGPSHAESIWDSFDGNVPIGLTCNEARLAQVKGLGPKRIKSLVEAFGGVYEGP